MIHVSVVESALAGIVLHTTAGCREQILMGTCQRRRKLLDVVDNINRAKPVLSHELLLKMACLTILELPCRLYPG